MELFKQQNQTTRDFFEASLTYAAPIIQSKLKQKIQYKIDVPLRFSAHNIIEAKKAGMCLLAAIEYTQKPYEYLREVNFIESAKIGETLTGTKIEDVFWETVEDFQDLAKANLELIRKPNYPVKGLNAQTPVFSQILARSVLEIEYTDFYLYFVAGLVEKNRMLEFSDKRIQKFSLFYDEDKRRAESDK